MKKVDKWDDEKMNQEIGEDETFLWLVIGETNDMTMNPETLMSPAHGRPQHAAPLPNAKSINHA